MLTKGVFIMKTKHYTLHGKKAAALALSVSLWLAGGGVASAGQTTTITEN